MPPILHDCIVDWMVCREVRFIEQTNVRYRLFAPKTPSLVQTHVERPTFDEKLRICKKSPYRESFFAPTNVGIDGAEGGTRICSIAFWRVFSLVGPCSKTPEIQGFRVCLRVALVAAFRRVSGQLSGQKLLHYYTSTGVVCASKT